MDDCSRRSQACSWSVDDHRDTAVVGSPSTAEFAGSNNYE